MTYAIPSYVRENLYILETLIIADEIVASVAL